MPRLGRGASKQDGGFPCSTGPRSSPRATSAPMRPRASSAFRRAHSRNTAATAAGRPPQARRPRRLRHRRSRSLGRPSRVQLDVGSSLRRGPRRRPRASLKRNSPMSRRLITSSERSKLDPFVVATGDASPRDQRDLMERPFFCLAKAGARRRSSTNPPAFGSRSTPCPSTVWPPSGTPTC